MTTRPDRPSEGEVFEFLDALRSSGSTNMMGAAKHLVAEFGFSSGGAKHWLVRWMKSFERLDKPTTSPD